MLSNKAFVPLSVYLLILNFIIKKVSSLKKKKRKITHQNNPDPKTAQLNRLLQDREQPFRTESVEHLIGFYTFTFEYTFMNLSMTKNENSMTGLEVGKQLAYLLFHNYCPSFLPRPIILRFISFF